MAADTALLVLCAAHAAFQVSVSVLVYPALLEVPDDGWARAHAAHSRRITWLVAVLYPSLLGVLGWRLVASGADVAFVVAAAGTVAALGATALVAAPAHGRLASGRTRGVVRRLLVADGVRTAGAVVALAGAVAGA